MESSPATIPSPPLIPGAFWRPAAAADLPAVRKLLVECPDADLSQLVEALETGDDVVRTLCAARPGSDFLSFAAARITTDLPHEYRASLTAWVHPECRHRGIGAFLLRWAEAAAREAMAALPHDRPHVLRVDLHDSGPEAVSLLERHGFQFSHGEYEMRRDLRAPVPEPCLPAGIRLLPLTTERAHRFYQVYAAAFQDRPGFPSWPMSVWLAAFTGHGGFRPALSFLAVNGSGGAGFVLSHVEDADTSGGEREGRIAQMGVVPTWRDQGVGTALLCQALRGFQAARLPSAALDVNLNNPAARSLYHRLGFGVAGCRITYRKIVAQ